MQPLRRLRGIGFRCRDAEVQRDKGQRSKEISEERKASRKIDCSKLITGSKRFKGAKYSEEDVNDQLTRRQKN